MRILITLAAAVALVGCVKISDDTCNQWKDNVARQEAAIEACEASDSCQLTVKDFDDLEWFQRKAAQYCRVANKRKMND